MSYFSYKTRNNSNPRGKARVYFCAHPDDYELLESVSNDILKHSNCSVWYCNTEAQQVVSDDFLFDLSQMQLFVIPVTPSLFSGKNRVTDLELPFAIENGIPVLPLLQEGVSNEEYAKVFGNLQYLSKHIVDNTAISFDDKLFSLLRRVLFGTEEVEAVRMAFRSYAFLSYRKKDRALAQRLMKTLHSCNDFWDVAIWYDEFITPGEDFSKNIVDALDKSELFLLNVTPSLLENNNYVATHEYPMAIRSCKPILPIVTDSVDLDEIRSTYPDIPVCVDLGNTSEIEKLLERLLLVGNSSSYSPDQKRYYIGLAYLNGIDVEVDREKAVFLISASAKAGLIEAQRTMVDLYSNGIGVQRDFAAALEWQERLVEQLKKDYLKDVQDPSARAYCLDECFCLARMYCQSRRFEMVEELLNFCRAAQTLYNTADRLSLYDLLSIGRSFVEFGELYSVQQDHEKALLYYKHALDWWSFAKVEKAEEFSLDSPERRGWATIMQNIAVCHMGIGSAALALERYDEARQAFEQAEKMIERLDCGVFTTQSSWNIISYNRATIYLNLGQIYAENGQGDKANHYFQKSIGNLKLLCEESKEGKYKRFLSVAYNRYGEYLLSSEKREEARACFEQSTELIRSVIDGSSAELKRDLAIALEMTARTYMSENPPMQTVIGLLAEAVSLREELTDRFGAEELLFSYEDIIYIYTVEGMVEEAFDIFNRAMKCYKSLDDESVTPEIIRSMSRCCSSLGRMSDRDGEKKIARSFYIQAVQYNQKVAFMTKDPEDFSDFAFSCMTVGTMPPDGKDDPAKSMKQSMSFIETALMVYTKLSADYPENPEYSKKLASVKSTYSLYKMLSGGEK